MSRENVEVVRAFFREPFFADRSSSAPARLEDDWRDVSEFFHKDFEYREDPSWPGAGTYRGAEAFRNVVSGYAEAFGEMVLELEQTFDAGDCVVAFLRFWARGYAGADAVQQQAGIFTVRDRRIVSWHVFFDRDQALEAAGLSE